MVAVSLDLFASIAVNPGMNTVDKQASIAYQGMAMMSVISVVSQTHLVAIAPRWLAEEFAESLELQVLPLPLTEQQKPVISPGMKLPGAIKAISGWRSNVV